MKNYDLIVVGGGPAGLTSAYQLNKFGFDVLLIEKNKFPRPKLCAGLITQKTRKIIKDIFAISRDELKKNKIINYSSDYYKIFYENKLIYESKMEKDFDYVYRSEYDDYFFNLLKNTEVEIIENTEVINIDFNKTTIITDKGNKLKANYIIGADGANSIIRKRLMEKSSKINFTEFKRKMAVSVEAIVSRNKINLDFDYPVLYYGVVNWGYGWVFPREDSLVIGLAALKDENGNFHDLFLNYLNLIGLKNKDINYSGWQLPYGNFIKNPIYKNVLLVGDAAGLVEPLTGEGIFYAHKSGYLAAKAINESKNQNLNLKNKYQQLLKDNLIYRLDKFKKLSKFFYSQPVFLQKILLSLGTKMAGKYLTKTIQEVKND